MALPENKTPHSTSGPAPSGIEPNIKQSTLFTIAAVYNIPIQNFSLVLLLYPIYNSTLSTAMYTPKQGLHALVRSIYLVIASILSLVNIKLIFKNSCAISGSSFCIFAHEASLRSQVTQSRSAVVVLVRSVPEKKGSSPHVVLSTISSVNFPCCRSYSALSMPFSMR